MDSGLALTPPRNDGLWDMNPDFASLHPGYVCQTSS
jgi:hypothetical protein